MFGRPKYFCAFPDSDELMFRVLKSPSKATVDIVFCFLWLEGI